jgi:hypothetical protein
MASSGSDSPTAKGFKPWIFAGFFCGIAGLFILVGTGVALSQAADLRRLVRTEATVVRPPAGQAPAPASAKADGEEDADADAAVLLRYRSGGQEHTVHVPVDPDAVSMGPRGVDTHPGLRDGMTVPVWIDPAAPEAPRLSPAPDFFPYLFILFPMVHLTVGLAVGLLVRSTLAGRARRVALLALVWNGVGGLCLAHYTGLGGRLDLMAGGAFAAYGVVGLGLVVAWWAVGRAAAAAAPVLAVEPAMASGDQAPPIVDDQPPAVLPDR